MKITKNALRQIIREEVERINEASYTASEDPQDLAENMAENLEAVREEAIRLGKAKQLGMKGLALAGIAASMKAVARGLAEDNKTAVIIHANAIARQASKLK